MGEIFHYERSTYDTIEIESKKEGGSTMTPLRKRRLKRKFQRFWKEWGITWEEFEVLLGAISIIMLPFLLRIFFAFFGI